MIKLGKEYKTFYILSEIEDAIMEDSPETNGIVNIRVSGRNKDGQDVFKRIYTEIVVAADGIMKVYDVRTLVRDAMIELKISIANVNVAMGLVSDSFWVLYADNYINMDAEDIKNDCFLLSDNTKMFYGMPKEDTLFWISSGGTFSAEIVANFWGTGDEYITFKKNLSINDNPEYTLSFHNIDFEEIFTEARNHFPDIRKMLSLTVISGNKNVQYFIHSDEDSEHRIYYFTNEFNVLEAYDMRGVTTEKTSAKQNIALCGHAYVAYDHYVEKTYSVRSAAFYFFQQHQVEALISARRFFVPFAGKAYECVFTDSEVETDDDIDNTWRVGFDFRTMQDVVVKDTEKVPERIFNEIFNFVYG